ncbi:MAG: hypothetical protein WC052_05240 [Patescibacteria group bacterium]
MNKDYAFKDENNLIPNVSAILGSADGIDAKTTGATRVYSVPSGYYMVATELVVLCTEDDTVTVVAQVSVGTSGRSYTDIIPSTTLTGLDNTGIMFTLRTSGASYVIEPGTDVYINIGTGATATSQTISAYIKGYLIAVT